MKCYGLFYGGSSYAMFDQFNKDHIEKFDSIQQAKDIFESRRGCDPYYPCVDDIAEMWVCFFDPFEIPDLYPDRIISIGNRGGTICNKV